MLRKHGVPSKLNKGVVEVVSDYTVCKEGQKLNPNQVRRPPGYKGQKLNANQLQRPLGFKVTSGSWTRCSVFKVSWQWVSGLRDRN